MGLSEERVPRDEYSAIDEVTHERAEQIVARNDPYELSRLVISVSLYDEDFDWAQSMCVRLARHFDCTVLGNAVLSFGYLARRFKRLDLEAIQPIYAAALVDSDQYVSSQAEDMLDEVRHHLRLSANWPLDT
jgi:hypothetical protein